jgi:hypothetical protein
MAVMVAEPTMPAAQRTRPKRSLGIAVSRVIVRIASTGMPCCVSAAAAHDGHAAAGSSGVSGGLPGNPEPMAAGTALRSPQHGDDGRTDKEPAEKR